MVEMLLLWFSFYFLSCVSLIAENHDWIIHFPAIFKKSDENHHKLGQIANKSLDLWPIYGLYRAIDQELMGIDCYTDGESVDATEHYFWGLFEGLAIELGALDGSPSTKSQTSFLQTQLNWNRILIEGNPTYRTDLAAKAAQSFTVNAAVCSLNSLIQSVHFINAPYIGGIIEFMSPSFVQAHHSEIYQSCSVPGDLSTIQWSLIKDDTKNKLFTLPCLSMKQILHTASIHHVNFFLLDVEGAELAVLQSIDFHNVIFDVLCVELTDRPEIMRNQSIELLSSHGYLIDSINGRNIWFKHRSFQPSIRPGLEKNKFRGSERALEDGKKVNHLTDLENLANEKH